LSEKRAIVRLFFVVEEIGGNVRVGIGKSANRENNAVGIGKSANRENNAVGI